MILIGSVVKTNVVQIRMLIVEEAMYLNCNTFNEVTKYHKPQGGYIRRVPGKIMDDKRDNL